MRRPRAQCSKTASFSRSLLVTFNTLVYITLISILLLNLYVDLVIVDYGLNVGTDARRLLLRYEHNTPPLDGSVSRVNNYQISSGPSLCHAPVVRVRTREVDLRALNIQRATDNKLTSSHSRGHLTCQSFPPAVSH